MGNKNYTDITHLVKKAQKNRKTKELLRTSLIWTSLIANFIAISLLFNFFRNQNSLNQAASKNLLSQGSQVLGAAVPVLPVRLLIPGINVDSEIEYVGVTPEGAMEVPKNSANVGWFALGPPPGRIGSAVISGHFDRENGEGGVFADLYKLKQGDKLYIINAEGKAITFAVRESRIYDPGYANEVFSSNDSNYLNLITCDGVWDGVKKSYSKRLVVFTDKVD